MKQEFTGKDLDSAIIAACSALQISRKDLQYEVLSTGASGIFGIVGRRDAKIRVKNSSSNVAETVSDENMEGVQSIVDEAFGKKRESGRKPSKKSASNPSRSSRKETEEDIRTASEIKPDIEDAREDLYTEEPVKEIKAPRPPAAEVTRESIALGQEAVQKMADLITDDAVVTAQAEADVLTLKIEGGNSGILIGRKGQTLDAMQFLVDKMINRKSEDRVRVRMDVEGYMETRKANLRHLAQKMAARAKKTGRPASINQMNAQDRRIIHMALKNDAQIRNQSVGEGYYRRLVIFSKKKFNKGSKTSGK